MLNNARLIIKCPFSPKKEETINLSDFRHKLEELREEYNSTPVWRIIKRLTLSTKIKHLVESAVDKVLILK